MLTKNSKGVIMSATKFLAGFIVGGAIGAIAGVLLAPKSGEETRAMIADTAKDTLKRAKPENIGLFFIYFLRHLQELFPVL